MFLDTSRLGSYRFSFPLEEVLEAYSLQFCSGQKPVLRVYETVLYKQEVMQVVLVHSPSNQDFSKFPLLGDDPESICTFRDGQLIWRPEAMCETHRYELICRREEQRLEARSVSKEPFYVWDHITFALHVGETQVLKFGAERLRNRLKFCKRDAVNYIRGKEQVDNFDEAKERVKSLWPAFQGPLERERPLQNSLMVSDIKLVLIGRPGVGKSSSGNIILGRNAFETNNTTAGLLPGHTQCCLEKANVFGQEVTMIDTPGLPESFDPALQRKIFKSINASPSRPHGILLVTRLGLQPEQETVKQVERMFGENIWQRTVVLITCEDQDDSGLQLQRARAELKSRLSKVENRLQILNINPNSRDPQQVWDLLHEITTTVADRVLAELPQV